MSEGFTATAPLLAEMVGVGRLSADSSLDPARTLYRMPLQEFARAESIAHLVQASLEWFAIL
jgi:hypothetical protein